jgi:4-alpha-glucanotransferase
MTRWELDKAARKAGIALHYLGIDGSTTEVPFQTIEELVAAIGPAIFDEATATPRYDLDGVIASVTQTCFSPDWLRDTRVWGIALQMYELRSERDWGIGDFEDLAAVCGIAASAGADFVGISPLHALFTADPNRCSPYSPSSRTFLNPIYIAVDRAQGYSYASEDGEAKTSVRLSENVDYDAVQRLKIETLRVAWSNWRQDFSRNDEFSRSSFNAFLSGEGEALRLHALFEALSHEMVAKGLGAGWRSWPEKFQHPGSVEVVAFAANHKSEIEFHQWMQWIAHLQLKDVAARAVACGLRLGLYLDFAVGLAPDGSATWSNPDAYLHGFSIGAPPDPFSIHGQNWGLAVPSPAPHQQESGAVADIRRVMQYAGLVRFDHVMGLWRLFAIPEGRPTSTGTYLHYPFAEALSAIAMESQRSQTVVVGEDLGNVPDGFREVLSHVGMHSYRVMYFEPEISAERVEPMHPQSLFCISTHDLIPLGGWWKHDDIALRHSLGLLDESGIAIESSYREVLRSAIWLHLFGEKMEITNVAKTEALQQAIHSYAAGLDSKLFAVRLADLLGDERPTNVPGTDTSYPNWRLKALCPIERWQTLPTFIAILESVSAKRPRSDRAGSLEGRS